MSLDSLTPTLALLSPTNPSPTRPAATGSSSAAKAAHEFESLLLTQWLEQSEKTLASLPGDDQDPEKDGTGDQIRSLGLQKLADCISRNGGIGIAAMLLRHLPTEAKDSGPQALSAPAGVPEGQ